MKKRIALAFAAVLLLGAGLYRWIDEEGRVHYSDVPPKGVLPKVEPPAPPPPPADAAGQGASAPPSAVTTLNTYLLQDPAKALYRLAIAIRVPDIEDAQIEAEFENPAGGAPLRGEPMPKEGSPRYQYMMVSPWFATIQCRSYAVTITVYAGADRRSPLATKRDSVVSRVCPPPPQ
jgi:hypothetical protein